MGTRHDIWSPPPPPVFGDSVTNMERVPAWSSPEVNRRDSIRTAAVVAGVVVSVFVGGFAAAVLSGAVPCERTEPRYATTAPALFSIDELASCVASKVSPPPSPVAVAVPNGSGDNASPSATIAGAVPSPSLSQREREHWSKAHRVTLARAKRLHRRGRTIDALQTLHGLLASGHDSAEAHLTLAKILLDRRDLAAASQAIDAAIARAPQDPAAHLTAAVIARDHGDVTRARTGFRRYLELAPRGRYAQVARADLAKLAIAATPATGH